MGEVIDAFLLKSTEDILKNANPRQAVLDIITLSVIQKYKLSREDAAVISIISTAVERRMWHNSGKLIATYANMLDITERMNVALEQAKRDVLRAVSVI